MTDMQLVPVTVLTGFLGSGKTTLINYLLEQHPEEKIAIVENEFGAVNIDSALLKPQTGVEIIELSSGCICCSVRGELTEALHDLLSRRDQGTLKFDRLILETTGLADPAPVVQTFFVDEQLRERIALDAVVTLVDCEHANRQMDENRVAVSQVGFADRLILTKVDRVDAAAKTKLVERLRKINARAEIIEADHGRLPRAAWIDVAAFNLDDALKVDPSFLEKPQDDENEHSWEDNIQSRVYQAGELDIGLIGNFMEETIERFGNDMLRYKGIFAIAGEPRRLIVQGVHKVVGFDYGSEWQPEETRGSTLVIIGRELPVKDIREGFRACEDH
ncbi:GTP-binding protein [Microvirga sp. W0021]|uniref:GTP-binding protein n=1 Tax=Hohaiivirga grylli TaxID=3133970 RepID=A0ABV0BL26_9HYPH